MTEFESYIDDPLQCIELKLITANINFVKIAPPY